jgi:hypothetical protein
MGREVAGLTTIGIRDTISLGQRIEGNMAIPSMRLSPISGGQERRLS